MDEFRLNETENLSQLKCFVSENDDWGKKEEYHKNHSYNEKPECATQTSLPRRRDRIPVYLGRVVITWTVDYLAAKILGAMDDSSASYIHMVQHLIEKCLIFHMTKEECMEALSKHANIKPVITSTGKHDGKPSTRVWNELEKENKEFFEAYLKAKSCEDRMSEAETSQMIQKMISESGSSKGSDD
ncbi:hypothetical protein Cgig2_003196 [Carnegiea gigantea]|uniref:Uncharacterized protein n=1 Tax=Carnegiea gigantea TaxID=171969 RepID=A0A9Q1QBU5_9CARY|nr:hypothetical protein Cgig2_003196 [Carnegiea gigantea]